MYKQLKWTNVGLQKSHTSRPNPGMWKLEKQISGMYKDNSINPTTYRYIQFEVSRFGEPVNHSGAKVMKPEAVNHVSAEHSSNYIPSKTTPPEHVGRTHM